MTTPSGCSFALGYESLEQEEGEAACTDGVDNDGDGSRDCRDPACDEWCGEDNVEACTDGRDNDADGFVDCADADCHSVTQCPEATATECSDGRDNDGDGRTDGHDARCWPHLPPRVSRCASLSGTRFDSLDGDLSSLRTEWVAIRGDVDMARSTPLDGSFTSTEGSEVVLSSIATFNGRWSGLDLTLLADLTEEESVIDVRLVPETSAPIGSVPLEEAAVLRARLGTGSTSLGSAGESRTGPRVVGLAELALSVERAGGRAVATLNAVPLPGGALGPAMRLASLPLDVDPDASTGPLRIVLSVSGRAAVRELVLEQPAVHPCDTEVPQLPARAMLSETIPERFGDSVSVASLGDGRRCALVSTVEERPAAPGEPRIRAFLSDASEPEQWSAEGALVARDASGAGIAWTGERLRAAIWRVERALGEWRLHLLESDDCRRWTPVPSSMPRLPAGMRPSAATASRDTLPADVANPSYVVRTVGGMRRHSIYWTVPGDEGPSEGTLLGEEGPRILRASSADGTTFELDGVVAELGSEARTPVTVQRVGNDLVMTHVTQTTAAETGVEVRVRQSEARWKRVTDEPLLEVSLESGRFDRSAIRAAALATGGTQPLLLYTGFGDYFGSPAQQAVGTARVEFPSAR